MPYVTLCMQRDARYIMITWERIYVSRTEACYTELQCAWTKPGKMVLFHSECQLYPDRVSPKQPVDECSAQADIEQLFVNQ